MKAGDLVLLTGGVYDEDGQYCRSFFGRVALLLRFWGHVRAKEEIYWEVLVNNEIRYCFPDGMKILNSSTS